MGSKRTFAALRHRTDIADVVLHHQNRAILDSLVHRGQHQRVLGIGRFAFDLWLTRIAACLADLLLAARALDRIFDIAPATCRILIRRHVEAIRSRLVRLRDESCAGHERTEGHSQSDDAHDKSPRKDYAAFRRMSVR